MRTQEKESGSSYNTEKEKVKEVVADIDRLLTSYNFNEDPAIFVERAIREKWEQEALEGNEQATALLERYQRSAYRSNILQVIVLKIQIVMEEYFPGEEEDDNGLYKRSERLAQAVHDAGAPKGKPISREIVQEAKSLLEECKQKLTAK